MAEKGTGFTSYELMALLQKRYTEGCRWARLTIPKQTGASALVQAHKTEIPHDPESRSSRNIIHLPRNFSLHLQSNFDNLERIRENLRYSIQTVDPRN
jgi:hypothetical protein